MEVIRHGKRVAIDGLEVIDPHQAFQAEQVAKPGAAAVNEEAGAQEGDEEAGAQVAQQGVGLNELIDE